MMEISIGAAQGQELSQAEMSSVSWCQELQLYYFMMSCRLAGHADSQLCFAVFNKHGCRGKRARRRCQQHKTQFRRLPGDISVSRCTRWDENK